MADPFVAAGRPQRRVDRISQAWVRIPVQDELQDFVSVRNIVLDWLRAKARRSLPQGMMQGETDSLDLLGENRVETVKLEEPLVWAARQDDHADDVRTWVTEAMLAAQTHSLILGYRLHCIATGSASAFERSIPRFMREVAGRYPIFIDCWETDLQPTHIDTSDDVTSLVELLTSPTRIAPVIGISMFEDVNGNSCSRLDDDRLARSVIGTAHVRLLSRQASFALTHRIGKRLSVFNGAVRVWLPGLNPEHDDPYSHPLWLSDRIVEEGPIRAQKDIADLVLRASARLTDAERFVPPFAEVRRVAATVIRDRAKEVGSSSDELLKLYEDENIRLSQEFDERKAEYDQLLLAADAEYKQALVERDEARTEVYALRARLSELTIAVESRERQEVEPIPDTFESLGSWADQYLGNGVEILPRALNAAKKSVYDDPPLAYRALLLMRNTYVPLRRNGSLELKEQWDAGLKRLGLQCSPTHAGSRAGENPDEYFVTYNGRRTEIDMHLKGSNSRDPRYCFRLYFFWSDENMSAVVAWLPSHLSTRVS